jgi:hypothetical protein
MSYETSKLDEKLDKVQAFKEGSKKDIALDNIVKRMRTAKKRALEAKLDTFISKNKGAGKQTKYLYE